jgi:hypothetical protein
MDRSHKLEYRTEDEVVEMRNQRRQDQYTTLARQRLAIVNAMAQRRRLQRSYRRRALALLFLANAILITYDVALLSGMLS